MVQISKPTICEEILAPPIAMDGRMAGGSSCKLRLGIVFKPCHCLLPLLVPKPMRCDEHQPITMLITHSLERDPTLHVAAWNWMRSTVIQHWPQPKTTFFLKRSIFQTAPFLQTCSHLVATLCFSMVYYIYLQHQLQYIINKYILQLLQSKIRHSFFKVIATSLQNKPASRTWGVFVHGGAPTFHGGTASQFLDCGWGELGIIAFFDGIDFWKNLWGGDESWFWDWQQNEQCIANIKYIQ